MPLESLRSAETSAHPAFTRDGIVLEIEHRGHFFFPFPAQELELDVSADAPMLVSATVLDASGFHPYAWPWRYEQVPRAPGTIRLDLRQAGGWNPRGPAALAFDGSGTVTLHAVRMLPVPDGLEGAMAVADRAYALAPESVGHTTINFLMPPMLSVSRGRPLADVIAAAGLVALVLVLLGWRLLRREWRPGLALTVACGLMLAAWNAQFLVRFLPVVHLSASVRADDRIRDNYYFAPALGSLAALARTTLRPDERVGVIGEPGDWFGPQTLCFNLVPRKCVIVEAGAAANRGISGIGVLRLDEMDAVVVYGRVPVPEDFSVVAAVSRTAYVARRR